MLVSVIVVLATVGYVLVATVLAPSIWLLFSRVAYWTLNNGTKAPTNKQILYSNAMVDGRIGYGLSWPVGAALLFVSLLTASVVFLSRLGMKLAGQ